MKVTYLALGQAAISAKMKLGSSLEEAFFNGSYAEPLLKAIEFTLESDSL